VLPNPAQMSFPGIQYQLPNYAGGNCYTRNTASFAFALQQSCNTPFASIALDLGQNAIREQASKFGFGSGPRRPAQAGLRPQRLPGRTSTRPDWRSPPSASATSVRRRSRSR
jgi:cell division protein FtsI/penicillin-binding protein 2